MQSLPSTSVLSQHREQLDVIVAELLDKHGLRLRFEEFVLHDENEALRQRLASSA